MAVPSRLYSEAIERFLTPTPGFEIIGSVTDPREILDSVRCLAPHVLFMDLTAQLIPRLEIATAVMRTHRGVNVVGMFPALHARHAELLLRSGVLGLLERDAGASEFVHAIVEVAAGRCYLSRGYSEALRAQYTGRGAQSVVDSRESLSTREEEVMHLIVRGFTSRNVGDRLFISPRTVENHVAELYRKLRLHDSHQLSCSVYRDEETEPPFGGE
jgi:DNA-binding NarL/FixJ family response regulator